MILILVLALATVNADTCPTISCGVNEGSLCYSYTQATNSAVAAKCAVDHTCGFDYTGLTKNYLCTPNGNPDEVNRWPGQKCSTTKICITGTTCVSGYCVGVALQQTCTSTDVCVPGAYCKFTNNVGTCVALIGENQACGTGDSCYYGHKCYSGLCKKQNVANGQPIDFSSCIAGVSELCVSNQCMKNADGVTAKCIAAYKLEGSFKECVTCTGTSSTSGTTPLTQNCQCGLAGYNYCPGFYGDTYHSKSISIGYDYIFGKSIKKCNINAGFACMEDYWDHDDYVEYLYYTLRAADNYILHNAKDCVLEAVAAPYLKLKNEYEDSSSSSSSFGQLFALSALVFTVVA